MELSSDLIKQLIKIRPHQTEIAQGISHQNRLRFHTQTILKKAQFDEAYYEFRYWISQETPELLPADKANRIMQLIRPPIPTVELSESIYSKLFKVFYAQDSYFDYRFASEQLQMDWADYRDKTFWATKGFEAIQDAIDSVWVVFFPGIQSGIKPEPQNKLINIKDIIDLNVDDNNNLLYVIFRFGDKVLAYDENHIRIYPVISRESGAKNKSN